MRQHYQAQVESLWNIEAKRCKTLKVRIKNIRGIRRKMQKKQQVRQKNFNRTYVWQANTEKTFKIHGHHHKNYNRGIKMNV